MAGLLSDVSMTGLKGSRNVDKTKRTVYNNNPMAISLRNHRGNVIPYDGLLGEQGKYEESLPDTMGQYIDPVHGLRAGIRNLRIQAKNLGGEKSLYDLISRWHGPKQGKQKTADYASMIAKSMGDSRNPKNIKIGEIDFNDSAVKSKIINPIISWEGGGAGLPQHIIDMAIGMEQGIEQGMEQPNKSYENAPQMYPPPKQQMQAPQQMQAQQLGLWDLIKDKASAMFGSEQPSPQQQQYESARMNRPPLSPPPMQQQMQAQMQQQQQMQAQQQMQQQQQQQMQMPKRRSLEEVTQTAQVQPALSPFPWLREVSGSYSYPSPPVGRWV